MSIFTTLNHQFGRCLNFLVKSQIPLCVYSLWKPIILTCQDLLYQLEQDNGFRDGARSTFFELMSLLEATRNIPSPCNLRAYLAEVVNLVEPCLLGTSPWDQESMKAKELLLEPSPLQRMIGVLGTDIFLQAPLHCCLQPESDVLSFMVAFKQFYYYQAKAKLIVEGLGQPLSMSDMENLYEKRNNYLKFINTNSSKMKDVLGIDRLPLLSFHIESTPRIEENKDAVFNFIPSISEEQYHDYLSLIEAILCALGRDDFRLLGISCFIGNDSEVSIPSEIQWSSGVSPIDISVSSILPKHEAFFVRSSPWPLPAGIVDFTCIREFILSGDIVLLSACCGIPSVVYQADVGYNAINIYNNTSSSNVNNATSKTNTATHHHGIPSSSTNIHNISRRLQVERNRQRNNFTLGKWVTRWNFNASRGQRRFFVNDSKSFVTARSSAINLRHEVENKFATSRSESSIERIPDAYPNGFWVAINFDEITALQTLTYFSVDAYGYEFAKSLAIKYSNLPKVTYKRPVNIISSSSHSVNMQQGQGSNMIQNGGSMDMDTSGKGVSGQGNVNEEGHPLKEPRLM